MKNLLFVAAFLFSMSAFATVYEGRGHYEHNDCYSSNQISQADIDELIHLAKDQACGFAKANCLEAGNQYCKVVDWFVEKSGLASKECVYADQYYGFATVKCLAERE